MTASTTTLRRPFFTTNQEIVVSKYQPSPEDIEDADADCTECITPAEKRRERKWEAITELYFLLTSEKYRWRGVDLGTALWKISKGPIVRQLFVSTIMGHFLFNKRSAIDKLLYRVYNSFEGASQENVDWRDVVCSLLILREYKQIRKNIIPLVVMLYDFYADLTDKESISVQRLITIFELPAITRFEMESAIFYILPCIKDIAPSYNYKPQPKHIPKKMFLDMLGRYKQLTEIFKRQAWARIPEDFKLEIVALAEQKSALRFEEENEKFMTRRAYHLYDQTIKKKVIMAFRVYIQRFVVRVRDFRCWEMAKRLTRSVQWWARFARHKRQRRLKRIASEALGALFIKHRIIKRFKQWQARAQVIKKISIPYDKRKLWIAEGLRILRDVWTADRVRSAFRRWFDANWIDIANETADEHYAKVLIQKNFMAFRSYVQELVKKRRQEEIAAYEGREIQKKLMQEMEQMQLALLADEEEIRKAKEEIMAKEREEKLKGKEWAITKRKAARQTDQRRKLEAQAEQRRIRVKRDKLLLRRKHNRLFEKSLEVDPVLAYQKVESWFDFSSAAAATAAVATGGQGSGGTSSKPSSPADTTGSPSNAATTAAEGGSVGNERGIDIIQREFKALKETFFEPPRIGEEKKERNKADLANIIFVYIDVMLNANNVDLEDLFYQYNTSGSGFMSHDEFREFMRSLPGVPIRNDQIREIIHKVDKDGNGALDLAEIKAAQKAALNCLGVPSSQWKMYVDPAQSVMCFHNILTDEKIFDYKMTDEKLMEILHDNLRAREVADARQRIIEEEPVVWRQTVENYSATIIQRNYRHHCNWIALKNESWRARLYLKKEREQLAEEATQVIRSFVLRILGRRELKYLARISFEKAVDPATGYFYYSNHSNGDSTYDRPRLLRRFGTGEDFTLPWSVQWRPAGATAEEQQAIVPSASDAEAGQGASIPYYYNATTGEVRDTTPEGYRLCESCRFYLACKQCMGPGCDGYKYCFSCFRSHHAPWSIRMCRGDHEGIPIKPVKCSRCKDNMAARTCNDCAVEVCKSCYGRIHRNPLLTHHTWVALS